MRFVQELLAQRLAAPALCIDATCGNGGDTAFLCGLCRASGGRVLGFDVQPEAIASTQAHLAALGYAAELHCDSHANLLQYVQPGTADAVMFNFGWLPGADHNVFSTAESSIPALEAALTALRPGGVLSAILYSGKVIGSGEKRAHPRLAARPAPDKMHRTGVRFCQLGRNSPPALPRFEKIAKTLAVKWIFC